MAWTAPITAVTNAIFTSAQFNASVRDNLLETAPAKATTAGSYFVTTGTNAIAERLNSYVEVLTSETTTSTTYVALTTAVATTVTTGTSALVITTMQTSHSAAAGTCLGTIVVSGASSVAASDNNAIAFQQATGLTGQGATVSRARLYTGLTAGSNTFTMQYKIVTAGTGTFSRRSIEVLPF